MNIELTPDHAYFIGSTLFLWVSYQYITVLVAKARKKSNVKYPAMTGDHKLECAIRGHYNTIERYVNVEDSVGRVITTAVPKVQFSELNVAELQITRQWAQCGSGTVSIFATLLCRLVSFLPLYLVEGIFFPIPAAISGVLVAVGRIGYARGYNNHGMDSVNA
jgi:hypothetical protein